MCPDDSLASDSRGSVVIGIVIILAFLVLLVAAATFTGFTGSSSNDPGDLPAEGEAAQLEAELQAALTEQSGVFSSEDDDWSFSPVHGDTGVVDFNRLEASLKAQGLLPQQRYWVQRAIDDVVAWDDEPPITTVEPRPANSTNATLVRTPDQFARVQTTDTLRSGDGELRDTVISIESASVGFGVANKTVLTVDGVVIELWRDKANLDQVWHQMTNSDGSAITDGTVPIDIDQQQMLTVDIADNQVNGQTVSSAYTGPGAADGFLLERSPSTQTLINVTSTAAAGATSVSFSTVVENRTANGTAPHVTGALGDPTVTQPVEKQQVVGTAVFSIANTNTETTSVEEVTINPEYQAYAPPERAPDFALDSLNIQSYRLNDPLITEVSVSNAGRPATGTVVYEVTRDGSRQTRNTTQVFLRDGESRTLTFGNYNTMRPGSYTARAFFADDSASDSVNINSPANVALRDLSLTTVEHTKRLTGTATVENTGGTTATESFTYQIVPTGAVGTQPVTLAPGETRTIQFTGPQLSQRGFHTVTGEISGDTVNVSVPVGVGKENPGDPPGNPPSDPPGNPPSDPPGDPPSGPGNPGDPPGNPPTDPATFSISSLSAPENPDPGIPFEVTASVTKEGGSGTGTVSMPGGSVPVSETTQVSSTVTKSSGQHILTASVTPCNTGCSVAEPVFVGVTDPRPVSTGVSGGSATGDDPDSQQQGQAMGNDGGLSLGTLNVTEYGLSKPVNAAVTVRNTGTQPVQAPVLFRVGGEARTKSVELSPGQTAQVSFDYYTIQQPGEYEAHAAFGSQSASTVLSVDDSSGPGDDPELSLGSVDIVDSGLGAPLETAVTVNNSGTQRGTGTLVYRVAKDGTTINKTDTGVVLNQSEEKTVLFDDYTIPSPGTYSVTAEFVGETGTDSTQITGTGELVFTDLLVSKYTPDEPISGVVTLTNTGSEIITETLRYSVSAENTGEVKSKPVSIKPGREQTVPFTLPSVPAPGDYVVGAEIAGQTKAVSADLTTPGDGTAKLAIENVIITDAELNQPLVTGVTVQNNGDQTETDTVTYTLTRSGSQQHTATSQVTVQPGTTVSLSFDGYTVNSPGTYRADVSFAGDSGTDTVTVSQPGDPDLTVDDVTVTGSYGEDLSTDVEITNNGGISGSGDVSLSLNPKDGTTGGVPGDRSVNSLAPGDSTTVSFTGPTVEPDSETTYTVTASITGDTGQDTITITPPSNPPGGGDPAKLDVTNIDIVNKGLNQDLVVDVTVTNNGGETLTQNADLKFTAYYPANPVQGNIIAPSPTKKPIGQLGSGDSTILRFNGVITDTQGPWLVRGAIKPKADCGTCTKDRTFQIEDPGGTPDVQVTSVSSSPSSVTTGETVTTTVTIENKGGGDMPGTGSLLTRVVDSSDQQVKSDTKTFGPIPAKSEETVTFSDAPADPDTYTAEARLDRNTDADCGTWQPIPAGCGGADTFDVTVTPPTVEIQSVSAPDQVTIGEPVPITATIKNTDSAGQANGEIDFTVIQGGSGGTVKQFSGLGSGQTEKLRYTYQNADNAGQTYTVEAAVRGVPCSPGCTESVSFTPSTLPDPPEFSIDTLDVSGTFLPPATVETVIKNIGEQTGSVSFSLEADGQSRSESGITLSPDETASRTIEVTTAGTHTAIAKITGTGQSGSCAGDCEETKQFTVGENGGQNEATATESSGPSQTGLFPQQKNTIGIQQDAANVDGLSILGLDVVEHSQGSPLKADVTVGNGGTRVETRLVSLSVGTYSTTQQVTVPPNSTETVVFDQYVTENPGTYSVNAEFAGQTLGIPIRVHNASDNPTDPAQLSLTNVDIVNSGLDEQLKTDVGVTNTGGRVGSETVDYTVTESGAPVESQARSVTLESGGTQVLSFGNYVTDAAGTYVVTATLNGETQTETVTIEDNTDPAPGQFAVDGLTITNAGVDEALEAEVSVTNVGGESLTGDLTLTASHDGTVEYDTTREVSLPANNGITLLFDNYQTAEPGDWTVEATITRGNCGPCSQSTGVSIPDPGDPGDPGDPPGTDPGSLALLDVTITNAGLNEFLNAEMTVKNTGGDPVTGGTLLYEALYFNSLKQESQKNIGRLNAGDSTTLSFTNIINVNDRDGNWQVQGTIENVSCDPCTESDSVNIDSGGNPPPADLAVTSVTAPSSVTENTPITATVTIKNNGGASKGGQVYLRTVNKNDQKVNGTDTRSFQPISGGDTATIEYTYAPTELGQHTAEAQLTSGTKSGCSNWKPDPQGCVASHSYTVEAFNEPAAFSITSFSASDATVTSSRIEFSVTVQNTGGKTGSVSVSVGTQDSSAAGTISLQNIGSGESASGSTKMQIDPGTYTGEASISGSDCANTGTCTRTDPVTIQTLPDPAEFSLSISTSAGFSQGSVTGTVTNTGDQQGSVTVKADVVQKGGSETKTETLSPGESLSVTEGVFKQGTWTGKVTITGADGNGCTGPCSRSEEFTVGPGTSVGFIPLRPWDFASLPL